MNIYVTVPIDVRITLLISLSSVSFSISIFMIHTYACVILHLHFQPLPHNTMCMCVFFYSSFVCISASANVHFKTTKIKSNIKILIAGVPSSQALPGFLITAPPSVCVSAVLGALAVWIKKKNGSPIRHE